MAEVTGNNPEGRVREVEGAQMPHELNPLYSWATRDILGSPSTLTEDYLKSLKESGVICGGGEEEEHYRVELPRRGERVCELNLEHPRVPHWLWVNESSIRCFELVTEYLELLQDPEVFLYLFTVFFPNAEGKAKKGYMSVRPGKYRRIFGLYEESFHDFKGRYFKVFSVGDHPPFWLTLERDAGRFPSYWSKDAGLNYVPVSYKKLNEEQRDTADILLWLFSKRFLKPKAVLGNPERAREAIRIWPVGKRHWRFFAKQCKQILKVRSFPIRRVVKRRRRIQRAEGLPTSGGGGELPLKWKFPLRFKKKVRSQQVEVVPSSPSGKPADDETTSVRKRPRTSEGSQRDLCLIDRSFDASGFIESNFMGPRAVEALRDYDPMESTRWVQWAMLRSATILKSVEPRLTLADHWERRCTQLTGEVKLLDLRRSELEKGKVEVEAAKSQAEKDLEVALKAGKEKDVEDCEVSLLAELESAKKHALDEKARADKADASFTAAEAGRQEVLKETEAALKEQILVLAPDFDVSLLRAFKEVVDGQIVDPPPES
ncbi:hypothetical protein PIB30_029164 [Stylosanthes scabra]|uniref:Uncharacterized protein n=1 Tax=Stylosanthes scabra TaxID=79078 RepID=A0ABU6Y9G0_9FABA|nr:hypothetical protein [Stylosanthes scabra]